MKKEKQILSPEQVLKLLSATDNEMYRALIALLYMTGCRISEALSLKRSDITIRGNIMYIQLITLKNRRLPLRPLPYSLDNPIVKIFYAYASKMQPDERLFPITRQAAHYMLRKLGAKIGVKGLHPHMFRHTRLTHIVLYKKATDQDLIMIAGWTERKMADRYIQLRTDKVKDVLDMDYLLQPQP